MNIWKKEQEFDYQLYEEVDSFFENLNGSKVYEHRDGQATMALDVVDALKNREILLIEAGVGIGKSWGYLVPLLYASKNETKFKGFLISTSSIALQDQLKEEIEKLSDMLDIHIPVVIAKGRNNFICRKRLEAYISRNEEEQSLKEIESQVRDGKIDKTDYPDIPSRIWKNININYVNCANCLYNRQCKYILTRKQWPEANYVICNHDLLVEALKRDSNDFILKDPSILIVDEAHNLENKIRNSYQKSISKDKLEALILRIDLMIREDDLEEYESNPLVESLNKIFRMISTKAKYQYRKNSKQDSDVLDEAISGFDVSQPLAEEIIRFTRKLEVFIEEASKYPHLDKKLLNSISSLKEFAKVFQDLISNTKENIYWVTFLPGTKDHVSLEYVRKDIAKEAAKLLGNNAYGKVFTSATMTTGNGDYNYFFHNLGLQYINNISITKEYPQESPYDYQNNALLYLTKDVISPKSLDHDLYLETLTTKIEELINITKGRSLVLFTSKVDMKKVYDRISKMPHDFSIMLQTDDGNADDLKTKFKEDTSSVLFATGSFFEGIDIKGESLENVIITKLPFPVVNPTIQEKASHFANGFQEVYLPEMIIKLKQGAGRLIRSAEDKGIVAILDSRYEEYEEVILESLPFTNVTTDIEDVKKFAEEKLGVSDDSNDKKLVKA